MTPANPEISSNIFDTYDISPSAPSIIPNAPPFLKSLLPSTTTNTTHDGSPTTSALFAVQKQITSIDDEDNAESIIMNHLHSVKSLKKFFEKKMVIQRPASTLQAVICSQQIATSYEPKLDRPSVNKEQKSVDNSGQRQDIMNKVLESLKRKKLYSRMSNGKTSYFLID